MREAWSVGKVVVVGVGGEIWAGMGGFSVC